MDLFENITMYGKDIYIVESHAPSLLPCRSRVGKPDLNLPMGVAV